MYIVIARHSYFNEQALQSALHQSPMSRECLIYLTPAQFLDLASPGFDSEKQKGVKELITKGISFSELPFIGVETLKDGNVIVGSNGRDHEGRHRARALLGVLKMIPVRLISREFGEAPAYRWGKTDKRPEFLLGHKIKIRFPKTLPYPRSSRK
jgi:hypothetical protein